MNYQCHHLFVNKNIIIIYYIMNNNDILLQALDIKKYIEQTFAPFVDKIIPSAIGTFNMNNGQFGSDQDSFYKILFAGNKAFELYMMTHMVEQQFKCIRYEMYLLTINNKKIVYTDEYKELVKYAVPQLLETIQKLTKSTSYIIIYANIVKQINKKFDCFEIDEVFNVDNISVNYVDDKSINIFLRIKYKIKKIKEFEEIILDTTKTKENNYYFTNINIGTIHVNNTDNIMSFPYTFLNDDIITTTIKASSQLVHLTIYNPLFEINNIYILPFDIVAINLYLNNKDMIGVLENIFKNPLDNLNMAIFQQDNELINMVQKFISRRYSQFIIEIKKLKNTEKITDFLNSIGRMYNTLTSINIKDYLETTSLLVSNISEYTNNVASEVFFENNIPNTDSPEFIEYCKNININVNFFLPIEKNKKNFTKSEEYIGYIQKYIISSSEINNALLTNNTKDTFVSVNEKEITVEQYVSKLNEIFLIFYDEMQQYINTLENKPAPFFAYSVSQWYNKNPNDYENNESNFKINDIYEFQNFKSFTYTRCYPDHGMFLSDELFPMVMRICIDPSKANNYYVIGGKQFEIIVKPKSKIQIKKIGKTYVQLKDVVKKIFFWVCVLLIDVELLPDNISIGEKHIKHSKFINSTKSVFAHKYFKYKNKYSQISNNSFTPLNI